MEQKFFTFEEALEKLGISADQLNELRERGGLRAYRDGSSWKFRGDEIERMATEGIPEPPPPSDIGLIDPEELVAAEPLEADEEDEMELADETQISSGSPVAKPHDDSELEAELGDTDTLSVGSELELEELEDTVTAGTSDLALDSLEPSSDPSDSILLSEEELGESVGPHASTIIGKSELESGEGDLELASDDDLHAEGSDVKLASPGASDVLSSQIAGSGVLEGQHGKGSDDSGSGDLGAFEDLEELEIDLAAESSRVLSPDDVGKAQAAAGKEAAPEGDSDLALDELELADDGSNMGSTDVPMLEAEGEEVKDEGSGSEIELASDADLLSSDGSGSDITLDSGDSGINLISPSDSGLALDDIPLDIGGSAILSSLSLGGDSDPEISLIGGDSDKSQEPDELQADDDFQLTPLSESGQEGEGDSSSQVIALDADIEELGEAAIGEFDDVDLTEEVDDAVVLSDDFGTGPAGEMDMGFAPAGVSATAALEAPYSLWNILALGGVTLLLMLCGIMMLDMVRNIWSWGESYSVSSALLDGLLGLFGLK